jgi:GNAT superfamily N-acetyltransferase
MKSNTIVIRRVVEKDAPQLLRLIEALAEYEQLPLPDEAAQRRLVTDLFRENPPIEAFIAEATGVPVGYALFLETYSSFLALPTLYLEDLFVLPEYRGKGVGSALFREMVAEASRRGCGRMEWAVLDWNETAIRFYDRLGARRLKEWQVYRLTRDDFERMLEG